MDIIFLLMQLALNAMCLVDLHMLQELLIAKLAQEPVEQHALPAKVDLFFLPQLNGVALAALPTA
jgi:hypothetical protein